MANDDEISLAQWVIFERLRVDAFAAWWRAGRDGLHKDIPSEQFPASMPEGEWDEQYRSWNGG